MAPRGSTVRIHGYREFLFACDRAGKETKKLVRGSFREVGEIVRIDAARLLSPVSARSAGGYRTRVRARGVIVEQSLRKTTGQHPGWGSYQMRRALVPSMAANEERGIGAMDGAIEKVCDHFVGPPV
jgi:hypothetical protein